TLPNVKEGSVIEYSYLVVSKFFININKYDLQYSIPVNKIDVKFASPEYFNYKAHQKGWIPIPIKESNVNKTVRNTQTKSDYSGWNTGKTVQTSSNANTYLE